MPLEVPQISFAGGVISPSTFSRVDLAKFGSAAKTLDNFFVQAEGGVSNRAGFQFMKEVKDSTKMTRIIGFEFNEEQAYVLEFGDLYIRFYSQGGAVLESTTTISGATAANPVVITDTGHPYTNGEEIYITGILGMTELNGKFYKVANKATNSYELTDINDVNINGLAYTTYSSAGTSAVVHTIVSPYLEADLPKLNFRQSNDTLYLTHTSYAPRKLVRTGAANWTLSTITFAPEQAGPTSVSATPQGATGSTTYEYRVTAVSDETAEESNVVSTSTSSGNASLSSTNFNRITFTGATGAGSYNIYKEDNGLYGFIGATETTTFDDENIAADLDDTAPKARTPFTGSSNYPGAIGLHEQRSVWGNTINDPLTMWLSQTGQFENMNVSSPTRDADAVTIRLVTGRGNEIRHFRSFQDRLFIFTSGAVWSLAPGGDVDAITPASKKLTIEEYLSITSVPPLTIKSTLLMVSGQANLGFEVHSLGYKFETDAYSGSDLTVLARHIFQGFTIKEWAYSERPFRLVAAVRDDGKVLIMTYLKEHQVFAWSVWEAADNGIIESVCSIPEGQEDILYFIVKRTVNGSDVKYIEHLHTRTFSTIEDAFFVDSGLTLNNPITITSITAANPAVVTAAGHNLSDGDSVKIRNVSNMTELNKDKFIVIEKTTNTFEILDTDGSKNVTAVTQANPGVVTTLSNHGFSTGDEVGFLNIGGMTQLNGNGYTITVVNDTTFSLNSTDTTSFTTFTAGGKVYLNTNASSYTAGTGGTVHLEVTNVTGLDHLEGESVIALADGNMVTGLTVSSGSVTLPNASSVVHIGLPYTAKLDSLPLDLKTQMPTISKQKIVKEVTIRVQDTRGLFIGPNEDNLESYPARSTELWGDPASTLTDLLRLPISDDWAREAGITIKSEGGLPMTILSMMVSTDVGS